MMKSAYEPQLISILGYIIISTHHNVKIYNTGHFYYSRVLANPDSSAFNVGNTFICVDTVHNINKNQQRGGGVNYWMHALHIYSLVYRLSHFMTCKYIHASTFMQFYTIPFILCFFVLVYLSIQINR